MSKSKKLTLNGMHITAITVTILLILGIFGAIAMINNSNSNERIISVTGNAQKSVAPDKAVVYLLIQTTNISAENAKDENAKTSEAVLAALANAGIGSGDIETENYNIYPEYDWSDSKQTLIGYKASNSIKVTTKEFNEVGKIVDASVDSGAWVNYINFELSKDIENKYKAEVMALASQDAKAKAEAIAEGLDKKIGRLISVSASDYNYSPWPLYRMQEASGMTASNDAAKSAVTDISPKDLEVYSSVSVSYKLN